MNPSRAVSSSGSSGAHRAAIAAGADDFEAVRAASITSPARVRAARGTSLSRICASGPPWSLKPLALRGSRACGGDNGMLEARKR